MAADLSLRITTGARRLSRTAVATFCWIALGKAGLMTGAALTMLFRALQP